MRLALALQCILTRKQHLRSKLSGMSRNMSLLVVAAGAPINHTMIDFGSRLRRRASLQLGLCTQMSGEPRQKVACARARLSRCVHLRGRQCHKHEPERKNAGVSQLSEHTFNF